MRLVRAEIHRLGLLSTTIVAVTKFINLLPAAAGLLQTAIIAPFRELARNKISRDTGNITTVGVINA